ncbi:hypothetical protein [Arsenophonus sp. PmNCSU2021_1]|uniref:hypothetical protein n=1 Tax=Arsenophonus sp. PmNCSU2021_1 TaxID=3118989 RepID=UPI002FEEA445
MQILQGELLVAGFHLLMREKLRSTGRQMLNRVTDLSLTYPMENQKQEPSRRLTTILSL